MFGSHGPAAGTSGRVGGGLVRPRRAVWPAAVAACAGFALTGAALAAGGGATLRASSNASLGKTIVVDAQGRTVYALSPETTHHLLCKSKVCLEHWPAVTVRSRAVKLKAGPGVDGRLGLIRRSGGKLQVTLRGMPVYTFSGDTSKGDANGEGIKAFGGTWHTLPASTSHAGTQSPTAAPGPTEGNGTAPTYSPTPASSSTPPSTTGTSTMTTTSTMSTQSATTSPYSYY
jgi:predicted lipoprotein with Yx(FWY)xxD motif